MTREQQEMTLWRRVFEHWYRRELYEIDTCGNVADAAVAEFRKRYPPQPAAPAPVWYDEPPRPGEYHVVGLPRVCWVDKDIVWFPVWDLANDRQLIRELPRNGRRVCPIAKPSEPNQ